MEGAISISHQPFFFITLHNSAGKTDPIAKEKQSPKPASEVLSAELQRYTCSSPFLSSPCLHAHSSSPVLLLEPPYGNRFQWHSQVLFPTRLFQIFNSYTLSVSLTSLLPSGASFSSAAKSQWLKKNLFVHLLVYPYFCIHLCCFLCAKWNSENKVCAYFCVGCAHTQGFFSAY